jgi:hypothetical protein
VSEAGSFPGENGSWAIAKRDFQLFEKNACISHKNYGIIINSFKRGLTKNSKIELVCLNDPLLFRPLFVKKTNQSAFLRRPPRCNFFHQSGVYIIEMKKKRAPEGNLSSKRLLFYPPFFQEFLINAAYLSIHSLE